MKSTARKEYEKRERRKKLRARNLGFFDWIVPIYAWLALAVLIAGVVFSWLAGGNGGVHIGAFGWVSLCLALAAWIVGRMGRDPKNIFSGPARRSIPVAAVVTGLDIVLLIVGFALR